MAGNVKDLLEEMIGRARKYAAEFGEDALTVEYLKRYPIVDIKNIPVPESAKHFDEPIPFREETWRDRPAML